MNNLQAAALSLLAYQMHPLWDYFLRPEPSFNLKGQTIHGAWVQPNHPTVRRSVGRRASGAAVQLKKPN